MSAREYKDACWAALAADITAGTVIALDDYGVRTYYRLDPAEPMSSLPHTCRGFNGQHCRVRFRDGREFITNNLLIGAPVPERFWGQLEVNADLKWLGMWGRAHKDEYEIRQQGRPDPWQYYPATPEGLRAAMADAEAQSRGGRTWEVSYTPDGARREIWCACRDGRVTDVQAGPERAAAFRAGA